MSQDYLIIKGLDQKIRAFVHTEAFRQELIDLLISVEAEKHTLMPCDGIAEIYMNYAPTYIKNNGNGDIDESTIRRYVSEIGHQVQVEVMSKNEDYYWDKKADDDRIGNMYDFVSDLNEPILTIFLKHYRMVHG